MTKALDLRSGRISHFGVRAISQRKDVKSPQETPNTHETQPRKYTTKREFHRLGSELVRVTKKRENVNFVDMKDSCYLIAKINP